MHTASGWLLTMRAQAWRSASGLRCAPSLAKVGSWAS